MDIETSIMKHFPFPAPREGQLDAIKFALKSFSDNKKFVILEAPTGAGKSAIALTLAGLFGNSYYLTVQKVLQDQLVNEFGESGRFGHRLVDLKGRNAYECSYYKLNADRLVGSKLIKPSTAASWKKEFYDCADGHCKRKDEAKYDECVDRGLCPYYTQLNKAKSASICLMNFSSFLYQTTYTKSFKNRKLMIIDEAHNIEPVMLDFISVSLNDRDFDCKYPKFKSAKQYATWIEDEKILTHVGRRIIQARKAEDTKKLDKYKRLLDKLNWFVAKMQSDSAGRWVVEHKVERDNSRTVQFKPVNVYNEVHNHLFNMADYVLMMSATILDVNVMARSLSIDKDQLAAKRMRSRFPVENRPIYYMPTVKVSGGDKQKGRWGPPITKKVAEICNRYPNNKGIVHTHNFSISKMLIEDLPKEVSNRVLFQNDFRTKKDMLEYHKNSDNTIIVAPAMHEGVDLIEDLSRFQIICKVPFPNFYQDKQLAARMEVDPAYYEWLTALKLVQSSGRSVRSKSDSADTYILDKSFKWWHDRNKNILPKWFNEAIQWPD